MSKKPPQPATAAQIYARHERKQAILGEIVAVKESIEKTHATLATLNRQCQESYTGQSGLERDLKFAASTNRNDNVATLEARIDRAKGKIKALDEKREEATSESHHLAAVLDRLEREELPACQQATTSEEVVAHQMAIADLEREAAGLDEAIQGKRRLIQEIRAELPALAERAAERCELLALVAINQATQAQVDELDAKIAAEQREHERVRSQCQAAIDQAEQAIAGLETMRAGIAERIDALKARSPFVMEQFLRSEMDSLAAAYVENARETMDLFIQLQGVNTLLYGVMGRDPNLLGSQELSIPGFNLKACRDVPRRGNSSGDLFRNEIEGQRATAWQKTRAGQLARLRELGINLI